VDEDQYGQGNGIRVAHSLTATDTTQTISTSIRKTPGQRRSERAARLLEQPRQLDDQRHPERSPVAFDQLGRAETHPSLITAR